MNILEELEARALARAEAWVPDYVKNLPDLSKINEPVLLGAYSFSLPHSRRRIIRDTIKISDRARETPSALARDYIRAVYGKGPRGTRAQLAAVEVIPPVPNVAKPGRYAYGFYIDIHACYWNIMLIAGWDVDYYPGLWLAPGRAPRDFPFKEHKVGRNCLVSSGRIGSIPRYTPSKLPGDPFDEIKPGNAIANNMLPRLIHDVLNSIADECIRAGAVYANNDGFIAPTPGIASTCIRIIEDWGLTTSIKGEGSGEVRSSGAYRVGSVESLPFRMRTNTMALENVYTPGYAPWLKRQFRGLV